LAICPELGELKTAVTTSRSIDFTAGISFSENSKMTSLFTGTIGAKFDTLEEPAIGAVAFFVSKILFSASII
jgi:hypothetical protein